MKPKPFWMEGKRLLDLRIIDVDHLIDGNQRIDIEFFVRNQDERTLFSYRGIRFIYGECEDKPLDINEASGAAVVEECAGFCGDVKHTFIDAEGMEQVLESSMVQISENAGRVKDVLLFHGLRKIFYQTIENCDKYEAHQKAVEDEEEYIERFYDDSLKEEWQEFMSSLKVFDPKSFS